MTLKDQLQSHLASVGASHAATTIDLVDGERSLRCDVAGIDRLGCEFLTLSIATPRLAGASTERLKKISAALSARLTYLLEPISPIEVDQEKCVVQMRSSPPQQNDDGTTYYELLVRAGGELSISRYTKARGAVRQPIAAQVTREVLVRLAGDLEQAATQ